MEILVPTPQHKLFYERLLRIGNVFFILQCKIFEHEQDQDIWLPSQSFNKAALRRLSKSSEPPTAQNSLFSLASGKMQKLPVCFHS